MRPQGSALRHLHSLGFTCSMLRTGGCPSILATLTVISWLTMTSFANNLQLHILLSDTPCGNRLQVDNTPWRLATSATYTKANSIVFSTLSSLQTTHSITEFLYQNIMSR